MKIKTYKLFESVDKDVENITNDINDMLYELRDDGFRCKINNIPDRWSYFTNDKNQLVSNKVNTNSSIEISIDKSLKSFEWKDVNDCIHRIFDYTYERGCMIKYSFGVGGIKYDGNFDDIKIPNFSRGIFNVSIVVEFGVIYRRYKHVRLYETFNYVESLYESVNEQDLKEICLELNDMGLKIEINIFREDESYIKINNLSEIPWSVLKEYALRIKDYLGNSFISFNVRRTTLNWYIEKELNDDKDDIESVMSFYIKYKDK